MTTPKRYMRARQAGLALAFCTIYIGRAQVAPRPASPQHEFDVATIKPSSPDSRAKRFMVEPDGKVSLAGMTVKNLIAIAYDVRDSQIAGGPDWTGTDSFDIEAKGGEQPIPPGEDSGIAFQKQLHERMRLLLADRFHLVVREERKEMSTYALVAAKGGPKLKPAAEGADGMTGMRKQRSGFQATSAPVKALADLLSGYVGRPVIDQTGLTGRFDWKLEWSPDQIASSGLGAGGNGPIQAAPSDVSGPSIFSALQEQLGLKLESRKAPALTLIVENASKPSAN